MVERGAAGLKGLDCRVGNLRQSLQARRSGINRSCFPGPLFDKGARTSRLARRFSAWTGEDAWGSFREEVIVQAGALQVNDMQVEATNEAAVAALKRLYILCSDHWTEVEALYSRLSRSGSGVRLIGRASAVAAALCKTAFIFRLDYDSLIDPKYFLSTPSRGAKLISFSFEGRQLLTIQDLSRLRQLEIHGLFALSLIEICRYRRLSDIKWSRHVLPCRFVPSWCREQADDRTTVLRIRPRANESTVERLINRWRGHYLSDLDMSDHGPVAADR